MHHELGTETERGKGNGRGGKGGEGKDRRRAEMKYDGSCLYIPERRDLEHGSQVGFIRYDAGAGKEVQVVHEDPPVWTHYQLNEVPGENKLNKSNQN